MSIFNSKKLVLTVTVVAVLSAIGMISLVKKDYPAVQKYAEDQSFALEFEDNPIGIREFYCQSSRVKFSGEHYCQGSNHCYYSFKDGLLSGLSVLLDNDSDTLEKAYYVDGVLRLHQAKKSSAGFDTIYEFTTKLTRQDSLSAQSIVNQIQTKFHARANRQGHFPGDPLPNMLHTLDIFSEAFGPMDGIVITGLSKAIYGGSNTRKERILAELDISFRKNWVSCQIETGNHQGDTRLLAFRNIRCSEDIDNSYLRELLQKLQDKDHTLFSEFESLANSDRISRQLLSMYDEISPPYEIKMHSSEFRYLKGLNYIYTLNFEPENNYPVYRISLRYQLVSEGGRLGYELIDVKIEKPRKTLSCGLFPFN